MSAKRAVVFVNGVVHDYATLAQWVKPGDFLIGADGGTAHILALGLTPHAVVGDLDSIDPAMVADLRARGVRVEQHPVAKDQTDLELAIDCGLAAGAEEILLVGALGGRVDQTLANLLILAQRDWPAPLRLVEENQVAQLLRGGQTLSVPAPVGATVSAIPLSPQVTGITYRGLEYPLENATLAMGSTRGVSNVVAHAPAQISIATGLLLVVYTI